MNELLNKSYRRVEHVETDASGVVHFSRYASWMETFILETFHQNEIGLDKFTKSGCDLRVASLQIKYLGPAYFFDKLSSKVKLHQLGQSFINVLVEVYRHVNEIEEFLITTGTIGFACVNKETGKSLRIPQEIYQKMEVMVNGN